MVARPLGGHLVHRVTPRQALVLSGDLYRTGGVVILSVMNDLPQVGVVDVTEVGITLLQSAKELIETVQRGGAKISQGTLEVDSVNRNNERQSARNARPCLLQGALERKVMVDGRLKMPLGGKLRDVEIADLTKWVELGALWPSAPTAPGKGFVIGLEQKRSGRSSQSNGPRRRFPIARVRSR